MSLLQDLQAEKAEKEAELASLQLALAGLQEELALLVKQLEEEVITPTTIICVNCGSTLELSISSILGKNIQQNCPLCGEPAD